MRQSQAYATSGRIYPQFIIRVSLSLGQDRANLLFAREYQILAPIGAGGMGEVYQALDTKLDREVAVKVLPVAVTSSADRLARFECEAKVLVSMIIEGPIGNGRFLVGTSALPGLPESEPFLSDRSCLVAWRLPIAGRINPIF